MILGYTAFVRVRTGTVTLVWAMNRQGNRTRKLALVGLLDWTRTQWFLARLKSDRGSISQLVQYWFKSSYRVRIVLWYGLYLQDVVFVSLAPPGTNLNFNEYSLSRDEITLNLTPKLWVLNRYTTDIAQIEHRNPAHRRASKTGSFTYRSYGDMIRTEILN